VTFQNTRQGRRCYHDEIAVEPAVVVQRNTYLHGRFRIRLDSGRRRRNSTGHAGTGRRAWAESSTG